MNSDSKTVTDWHKLEKEAEFAELHLSLSSGDPIQKEIELYKIHPVFCHPQRVISVNRISEARAFLKGWSLGRHYLHLEEEYQQTTKKGE